MCAWGLGRSCRHLRSVVFGLWPVVCGLWSASCGFWSAHGRSTGSGACGFGAKSRAGLGDRYANANLRAPLTPKPGPLTQSPCLEAVGAERFNAKTGCSPCGISADSYQNVYQCSFDTCLMSHSTGSPVRLDKSLLTNNSQLFWLFFRRPTSLRRGDWVR